MSIRFSKGRLADRLYVASIRPTLACRARVRQPPGPVMHLVASCVVRHGYGLEYHCNLIYILILYY